MITIRVWKVTEYDVTMEDATGTLPELLHQAQKLAAQGHTTDIIGVPGVIDRGTFPVIRSVTEIKGE